MTPEEDILDSLRAGPMSPRALAMDTGRPRAEVMEALERLHMGRQVRPHGKFQWIVSNGEVVLRLHPPGQRNRVLRALIDLVTEHAVPMESGHIAARTGLTQRRVTCTLQDLRRQGLVVVARGKRWLPTPPGRLLVRR